MFGFVFLRQYAHFMFVCFLLQCLHGVVMEVCAGHEKCMCITLQLCILPVVTTSEFDYCQM